MMRKNKAVILVLVVGLVLLNSQVFAGGVSRTASEGQIGVPPEAMERVSNITPHRGNGEFFTAPIVDFLSRVIGLYIPAGDKTPGPGWGVPEGHNIGNAPTPPVIGKHLDRSSRGKMEPVVDFLDRVSQQQAHKR